VLGRAPEFTGTQRWFNTPGGRPLTLAGLRGRVVLVDFWTYTCINCLRTLPYVSGWYDRYHRDGFVVVGVHTPEFGFEHDAGNVGRAVRENHLRYPVVQDNAYATWTAWGNDAWPADYLIDARGRVREAHAGEGDYAQTEADIRALLREAGRARLGVGAGVHGGETAEAGDTPETYVGAARAERFAVAPHPGVATYPPAGRLPPSGFALGGRWRVTGESATAASPGAAIDANVHAKSVYLVLSGPGRVHVALDGRPTRTVTVRDQRLYTLASLPRTGDHRISLRFDAGVSAFAFTFG
jgi:thiol-disulfide isomerase/thioredoxin